MELVLDRIIHHTVQVTIINIPNFLVVGRKLVSVVKACTQRIPDQVVKVVLRKVPQRKAAMDRMIW